MWHGGVGGGHTFWRHIGRRRAQNGRTALMCSAEKGHADCMRLLLDAGADKEAKTDVLASAGWVGGVGG